MATTLMETPPAATLNPPAAPGKSALERFVEPFWGKLVVLFVGVMVPVSGQILLKLGTQQTGELDFARGAGVLVQVFTNPLILTGIVFFAAGLLLYLTLISILDISLVYPVGAFAYVVTTVVAALGLFGMDVEPVSPLRLLGLTAIIAGVSCIAWSGQEKEPVTLSGEDAP